MIARILSGERDLFHDLIKPYERGVYVAAYSILQNEADAEDVAQEAVLKAFVGLRNFRGESRFNTWLLAITLNEARARLRRVRSSRFESLSESMEEDDGDYTPAVLADWRFVPSEALEQQELRNLIQEAIAQLSLRDREILLLRDIRELSIAETAKALGKTEGVVKIRLFRARLRLQKMLAPRLGTNRRGLLAWFARKGGVR
ncbi:MAG: sigma-70 family RNA polymerase sigma factor [Terriglobia bacterium]|nr:sigma-70 family RNA polymerase sigma factor [Terriglobia bacterium]